jgi:hypothetical protein
MATSIGAVNPYRLQGGTLLSAEESARNNPGMLRTLTEAEIAAMREAEAQMLRQQHMPVRQERIYGQVLVDGQVFATVFESGSAQTAREIGGLTNDGSGQSLASARLREIAKAVGGEIRRADFLPTASNGRPAAQVSSGAGLAGRRLDEMLQSMSWDSVRSRLWAE